MAAEQVDAFSVNTDYNVQRGLHSTPFNWELKIKTGIHDIKPNCLLNTTRCGHIRFADHLLDSGHSATSVQPVNSEFDEIAF